MISLATPMLAVLMVIAIVMGPAVLATWFILRQKRRARQERRSPLTTELVHTPGYGLRERLEDGRVDLVFDVVLLLAVPGLALSTLYAISFVTGTMQPTDLLVLVLVVVGAYSTYQIRSLLQRSKKLDQLRLGLDAELAAGQELDQLMRQGAVVFHDMPGDKFNIDHVVIAPQGVFAVETKGYRKPNRDGGADDARVVYDGKVLKFPDWASDKPLVQSQRQARWLGQWLTSATGEQTEVTPVLALPGWFVDRQGRGPVQVFDRTGLRTHLLKVRDARPLGAEQMQRVVHQVEQRCRDVKPTYRPESDEG